MSLVNLDLYSYELAMNTQAALLLPERRGVPQTARNGKPYPVLYLLHGHGQDHTSWLRLSRLEAYLKDAEVIVVMPNGTRGSYVDGVSTYRYGSYLTEELPVILRNWFHITEKREETFIAGISMGGYGALRAALACPEKYAAAAGLSSAIRLDRVRPAPEGGLSIPDRPDIAGNYRAVFGSEESFAASAYNLENLARDLQSSERPRPRLLQVCGDRDPLRPMNDEFAEFMKRECPDVPLKYEIRPGLHTFDFWDQQIQTVLEFFGLLPPISKGVDG